MIGRISLIFILISVLVISQSLASVPPVSVDVSKVLNSRKVVGIIYFKANHLGLTKKQKVEIDRIVSSALEKRSKGDIIRLEGFATSRDQHSGIITASMTRARSVWNYLNVTHKLDRDLYLTGFDGKQTISTLRGGRVEIVLYDNPFLVSEVSAVAVTSGR